MSALTLSSNVVFIIVCSTLVIEEFIADASVPYPKSSLVELKTNQENANGVQSNSVDIHVTMESAATSLNINNQIREELNSILKNCNISALDKTEEKTPMSARSVKYDSENDSLAKKMQNIENLLNDIQADNEKFSSNNDIISQCSKKEEYLGVICNTCTKSTKNKKDYPRSCKEILRNGNNVTGIYEIFPKHAEAAFHVLCDMETKGGGWAHIQKRFDGSQDFYLEWKDYKFGFGNFEGEFWLGLQKIYLLSGFEPTELLVEIVDRDNVSVFAHYTSFAIGSEPGGYKLVRVSGFSGDAGDSLTHHLGAKFSTKDLDFTKLACPTKYRGAYWYVGCYKSNLNGRYINIDLPENIKHQGLEWQSYRGEGYCHAKSRMLVRPLN